MLDGLHSDKVTCIREDNQGRIWLATDAGLNVMENDRITNAGLEGKSLLNPFSTSVAICGLVVGGPQQAEAACFVLTDRYGNPSPPARIYPGRNPESIQ